MVHFRNVIAVVGLSTMGVFCVQAAEAAIPAAPRSSMAVASSEWSFTLASPSAWTLGSALAESVDQTTGGQEVQTHTLSSPAVLPTTSTSGSAGQGLAGANAMAFVVAMTAVMALGFLVVTFIRRRMAGPDS
jgi:hypothetical protein